VLEGGWLLNTQEKKEEGEREFSLLEKGGSRRRIVPFQHGIEAFKTGGKPPPPSNKRGGERKSCFYLKGAGF